MNFLAVISLIMLLLGLILLVVASLLAKKSEVDREKSSPFECGFDPEGSGRLAFSMRFFLIAVVFMVFDVEVALLLPMMISGGGHTVFWAMLSVIFLVILLLGTFHEWLEGSLDWEL